MRINPSRLPEILKTEEVSRRHTLRHKQKKKMKVLKIQSFVSEHTFLVWNDERIPKKSETKRVIQIKANINISVGVFFLFHTYFFILIISQVFWHFLGYLLWARMSKRLIILTTKWTFGSRYFSLSRFSCIRNVCDFLFIVEMIILSLFYCD